jgi:hypothetical protein
LRGAARGGTELHPVRLHTSPGIEGEPPRLGPRPPRSMPARTPAVTAAGPSSEPRSRLAQEHRSLSGPTSGDTLGSMSLARGAAAAHSPPRIVFVCGNRGGTLPTHFGEGEGWALGPESRLRMHTEKCVLARSPQLLRTGCQGTRFARHCIALVSRSAPISRPRLLEPRARRKLRPWRSGGHPRAREARRGGSAREPISSGARNSCNSGRPRRTSFPGRTPRGE